MRSAVNYDQQPALNASKYNKADIEIGVVHVGLGAFHRAHQAYYLDAYMDKTGDLNWGIAAVNLRKLDGSAFSHMATHEDGYVLKSISASGDVEYDLIRAHLDHIDWNDDYEAAINLLANKSVKLITMTVTESGYYLDSSGNIDPSMDQIHSEINGGEKQSIYSYLRAGLNKRIEANAGPITIMCCDNLRENGKLLKRNFLSYLSHTKDDDLINWLTDNASFPCSMVDRITPRAEPELALEIQDLFGRQDDSSVLTEDFVQWVIEDDFKNDFPKLSEVDVTITPDIDLYEETKIRVLNGGHTCLVYLGAMMGYSTYDELLTNAELKEHFDRFEHDEVLPVLPKNLPFDSKEYLKTVTTRFTNSYIADRVERICMDGYSKFPIFIMPTVRECFEAGITPKFAIRSIASWYVFSNHIYNGKFEFKYIEPYEEELKDLVGSENLDKFVSSSILWGDVPQRFEEFGLLLRSEIESLEKRWPL